MTPDPVPPLPSPELTVMVTTLLAAIAAAPSTVPVEFAAAVGAALVSRCTLGAVATVVVRPWSASATAPPPTAPPMIAAAPSPAIGRSHGRRPRGGGDPAGDPIGGPANGPVSGPVDANPPIPGGGPCPGGG